MGGAVMTDAGLACHATDCLGRYLPGQRNPGPDTIASYRDASGLPVDYFGDRGKEPESMSMSDPGGRAVGGFLEWPTWQIGRASCRERV